MAARKHSRQRDSIKEFLMTRKDHPTADIIYTNVRQRNPNISLGTVYRNLNLLADKGEAIKISTPDGGDRFDGRTDLHYHVICRDCKRVYDLELDEQHIQSINDLAGQHFDGTVDSHTILFYGTCKNCLNKNCLEKKKKMR